MFDQIPNLLDKDFVIGFFLPTVILILLTLLLSSQYDTLPTLALTESTDRIDVLIIMTIISLLSYVGGVLLLAINGSLFMFIEGYGKFNPLRLLEKREKKRYRKLQQAIKNLDMKCKKRYDQSGEPALELEAERDELLQDLNTQFPDDELWLLPTRFGNVIRSFQTYSRVMYGLDAVPGWYRLFAILPEHHLNAIGSVKARVDFWVNLIVVSFIFLIEYCVLSIHQAKITAWWMPLVTLVIMGLSYSQAISSAIEWGNLGKAVFDVFLPTLREKLEFPFPKNPKEERELWQKFSQAVIYNSAESLPRRSQGRRQ
jgi:hypothetical protein